MSSKRINIDDSNESPKEEQEAKKEAVKETIKETDKSQEKFEKMVSEAGKELYRCEAVFPFDIFPDQIIIDLNKVNIIKKMFFYTGRVHSVFIQDITDVFVSTSIFFATLEIIDSGFKENSIKIPFLKKDHASKARRIIQGLIVAKKQQIDLSAVGDVPNLTEKLEKLGESKRE